MTERAIYRVEKIIHFNENCFHVKTPFFDHKIKTLFTRFDFDFFMGLDDSCPSKYFFGPLV